MFKMRLDFRLKLFLFLPITLQTMAFFYCNVWNMLFFFPCFMPALSLRDSEEKDTGSVRQINKGGNGRAIN